MKNQVKVKRTITHKDSQKSHRVCEGALRLLKSKTSADIERSNVYIGSIGYTAIVVSYEEEIKNGDRILHNGSILTVGENKGLYLSTQELPNIDIRVDYCAKILVFPENFSFKQLEAIIDGKMRDKSRVLIECESTPVDYVTDTWSPDGHYVGNQIKLDTSNNITLFRSDKETINDLKAQLFALANKFAGDEYGHVAVQLHQIHNSIND